MKILEEWDEFEFLFENERGEKLTAEFDVEIKDSIQEGHDRDQPSEGEREVTIDLGTSMIIDEDGDCVRFLDKNEKNGVIQCLTDHFSID